MRHEYAVSLAVMVLLPALAACVDEGVSGALWVRVYPDPALAGQVRTVGVVVTGEGGVVAVNDQLELAAPGWGGALAAPRDAGTWAVEVVARGAGGVELARARLAEVELVAGRDTAAVLHLVAPAAGGEGLNAAPVVEGLAFWPAVARPGEEVALVLAVRYDEVDVPEVTWEVNGGAIAGNSAAARWTAPTEVGAYRVDVTVRDGGGGVDTAAVQLEVQPAEALAAAPEAAFEPGPVVDALADLPETRAAAAATPPIDGVIYIMGGTVEGDEFSATVWAYDVASDTYAEVGDGLPFPMASFRRNSAAVAANGRVYLSPSLGPELDGGYGSHACLLELEPSTGAVRETRACYPQVRWAVRLVADASGTIYTFGGWHDFYLPDDPSRASQVEDQPRRDVWRLDTEAETLTLVLDDVEVGGDHIMVGTLGPDGVIYLFERSLGQVVAFDPADESFVVAGAHGQVWVHDAWEGEDGRIHGLGIPQGGVLWGGGFVFDPASGEVRTTSFGRSLIDHDNGALSLDRERRVLYQFGGEVGLTSRSAVTRLRTLP